MYAKPFLRRVGTVEYEAGRYTGPTLDQFSGAVPGDVAGGVGVHDVKARGDHGADGIAELRQGSTY